MRILTLNKKEQELLLTLLNKFNKNKFEWDEKTSKLVDGVIKPNLNGILEKKLIRQEEEHIRIFINIEEEFAIKDFLILILFHHIREKKEELEDHEYETIKKIMAKVE
ncbi:TPA: hypothetical protein DEP21_00300 [Patescibacteria group bacterium]|nr:hypothetical protein [Candidatus Gracilibacteria bacterium]